MYSYKHSLGGAEEWKTVNILQNIFAEVVAVDMRRLQLLGGAKEALKNQNLMT
jgi:hypothetical protein